MNYHEAIDYVYKLGHETLTMKPGLANIMRLTERLGHPEQAYKIIHVAGTNGKGSFCAMLATILERACIPGGLFTSPHLIDIEERFRFNLEPIKRNDFSRLIERIKRAVDQLLDEKKLEARPTFFEHITALGFEYFRDCAAQISIIEVGLGGRLDSTNIVDPLISIITPIDYDHQQYLGNSLTEIAIEKAGILRAGVPALIAPQTEEARRAIEQKGAEIGVPLIQLDRDRIQCIRSEDGFWHFDFEGDQKRYEDIKIGLRGRHQVETAALVILASEYLISRGIDINSDNIRRGISEVCWPGRLELIYGAPELLLDGAHNPGGVAVLRSFLDEWIGEKSSRYLASTLIFSTMRDKDLIEMAEKLFPIFDDIILVERDDPRAIDPRAWQDRLSKFGKRIIVVKGIDKALDTANSLTDPKGLIVATGSLHLIGEIKSKLVSI
jgi:dihydrofolate synthase / folylpolyglutamate synthase